MTSNWWPNIKAHGSSSFSTYNWGTYPTQYITICTSHRSKLILSYSKKDSLNGTKTNKATLLLLVRNKATLLLKDKLYSWRTHAWIPDCYLQKLCKLPKLSSQRGKIDELENLDHLFPKKDQNHELLLKRKDKINTGERGCLRLVLRILYLKA